MSQSQRADKFPKILKKTIFAPKTKRGRFDVVLELGVGCGKITVVAPTTDRWHA